MPGLDHYLRAWKLAEPHLLAQTRSSHVYRVQLPDNTDAALKLLTSEGAEERNGAVALRHFGGQGAVTLIRDELDAQLLEYADGEDLKLWVASGRDAEATEVIAGVINKLHSIAGKPLESIPTLNRWFKSLFDRATAEASDSIFVRAATVGEATLAHPEREVVLHGDIHHENIRHSPRGWLAFDPKGIFGDRAFELANTLCNPGGCGVSLADRGRILRNGSILAERCQMDFQRVMVFLFLYATLSACWTMEDQTGEDVDETLRIAHIAEELAGLQKPR